MKHQSLSHATLHYLKQMALIQSCRIKVNQNLNRRSQAKILSKKTSKGYSRVRAQLRSSARASCSGTLLSVNPLCSARQGPSASERTDGLHQLSKAIHLYHICRRIYSTAELMLKLLMWLGIWHLMTPSANSSKSSLLKPRVITKTNLNPCLILITSKFRKARTKRM